MRLVNLCGLLMTGTSALCLVDFSTGIFAGNARFSEPETSAATQVVQVASTPLQRSMSAAISSEPTPISFQEVAAHVAPQTVTQHDAPKSVQAGDVWARRELAVEIKRGLKRLGCFDGSISGDWDRSAQLATRAFLASVNARLPFSEPDLILAALVRAQVSQISTVAYSQRHSGVVNSGCLPSVVEAREIAEVSQKKSADAAAFSASDRMSLGASAKNDAGDEKSAATDAEPSVASQGPPTFTVSVQRTARVSVQGPTSWRKKVFDNSSGR